MTKVSRRGFLGQTSAGAATIGALLAMPGLAEVSHAAGIPREDLTRAELEGPIVARVKNLNTGEIAIMVGTREIVYHDRQFVKRLVKAMR